MENSFRKCVICERPAFSHNYGVLSCDACKMFFRRVVTLNRDYKCIKNGLCTPKEKTTTCKGCRYKLCQDSGMTFQPNFMDLKDKDQKMDVTNVLGILLFLDARRSKQMKTQFTDENFSLVQVLENRRMKLKTRRSQILTNHDWSFFGIYTSIEFFMSLDFMADEHLQTRDKEILLTSFCVKASLFASAMRAVKEKRDKLMTVDGKDVYPDEILKFKQFSLEFLKRIRSLLVAKMIELRLTIEEFVLCNVILFCNPALLITGAAQDVISRQQNAYTSALLEYCNLAYGKNGPSRFTDLLSLFHVINKNFEDVQAMTVIFKLCSPQTIYRRIVTDVI
ncbi:unnamed protein product [Caenorhabditis nigoni]